MKRIIFLTGIMACFAFGVSAQVTPPGDPVTAVPQSQDSRALTFPYMGQGAYNTVEMNQVPQNIQSNFGTDFRDIKGAKWEYNNDVYRSSFTQDGRNRAILYGQDGRVIETRTSVAMSDLPASVQDALKDQNASSPYEIKVGENTYYATQIGGKVVYYNSNGGAVTPPTPQN